METTINKSRSGESLFFWKCSCGLRHSTDIKQCYSCGQYVNKNARIEAEIEKEKQFKKTRQAYIKALRNNSKKYHKKVLKNAVYHCEICGWNAITHCLEIHHICPVSVYSTVFLHFMNTSYGRLTLDSSGLPPAFFELANQIALCPNCHKMIHALLRKIYIFKGDSKASRDIYRTLYSSCLRNVCGEYYDSKKNTIFYSVLSGQALKTRLFKDEDYKHKMYNKYGYLYANSIYENIKSYNFSL